MCDISRRVQNMVLIDGPINLRQKNVRLPDRRLDGFGGTGKGPRKLDKLLPRRELTPQRSMHLHGRGTECGISGGLTPVRGRQWH